MLPSTRDRVPLNTRDSVNQAIAQATRANVRRCEHNPGALANRLQELDREWDIERTLEANAASVTLIGVGLATLVDRRFLLLPAVVGVFLLQHALEGWCPPVPIFRSLGFRTEAEIDEERYALKALRGDFRDVGADGAAADRALEAARH